MPNEEKQAIINLVKRLLCRSGLTIDQVAARMEVAGCPMTRTIFENHFTTRVHHRPHIQPEWLLALVAALTDHLADQERCTAAEAIELARLARLPIDQFRVLKNHFPLEEFAAAYGRYAPLTEEMSMINTMPGK